MKFTAGIILFLVIGIAVGAYFSFQYLLPKPPAPILVTPTPQASPTAGLANPASEYCVAQGGQVIIQTRGDGGAYGLCTFDDARVCEEWAMLRGECPVGGVKTTGYDTIQQKYCAWSGGQTLAESNATCTFKDGSSCSVDSYYNGSCEPNAQ